MDKKKFIDNIAVEGDMFKCMNTQGVIITVSSHGGKPSYIAPTSMYGVNEKELDDNEKEFIDEHLSKGKVSFIPKSVTSKINSIETKSRSKIREYAIGYNNSYVPIVSYPEVMEILEGYKEEFDNLKKELVDKFDDMIVSFKTKAALSVVHIDNKEAKDILEKLFKKLPTKEKFEESLQFEIRVSTFLTTENMDLLPEDVQKKVKESKERSSDEVIKEGVITILNETITYLSSVLVSAKKNGGKPAPRTVMGLKNQARRIGQKNIFGNSEIAGFKSEIENMVSFSGEEQVEHGERLLAKVYNYSMELSLEEEIDLSRCPFSEKQLEELYEMYFM